jgi:digeranylgeranylglycerophospholipid reductase
MIQGPDCYDIAIIGGGLAGLSAAVAIGADSEARVVLIDKDVGHNNPTPITFSDVVQRFGLEDSVVNRYRGFSVHSSLGSQSLHYYSDFPLVSLDYRWACYILLTRAQQSLGFTWQRGYATGLAKDGEGWMISVDSHQRIRAPLLIDASGRAHFAARCLHLARPRMYSHCYGQFFAGCRFTNHELAEDVCLFLGGSERFGNGGGWCYPLGAGRISFGFASVTDSSRYPLKLVRQRYQRALQELAPYADVLARGKPGPVERGSIPLGPVRRFVYDGLMLVGDAAGQATPWACMGSESALINGQTCGRVAAKAFKQGDLRAKVLREYETVWAQANRRSYHRGTMLAPLQWTHSEEVWEKITASYSHFTPEEALAHLRHNEPIHRLPILGRGIVYDRLGWIGQGIRDWVQQHLRILRKKAMARLVRGLMAGERFFLLISNRFLT